MVIRQKAEEIVSLKSRAIGRMIQDNLENNRAIAVKLHEDFAQGIASSLLFLKSAEENNSKRLTLIKTAGEQLYSILDKIKTLSYTLTPITANWLLIEDLVQEYINNVADTFTFEIRFKLLANDSIGPSPQTPLVIHIIESWLKKLAAKRDLSLLMITLETRDHLELVLEDNAPYCELQELNNDVADCLLGEMSVSGGGKIEVSIPEPGRNRLKFIFPTDI